ncbi:MAG: hypothetical protein WC412_03735 [Candidatus Omnitrophota bacterium]|jgi:hypothetical protein
MTIDKNFFVKQNFRPEELSKYKQSAKHNLGIAKTNEEPEVVFHFTYMALIKIGIYCLAKDGYRAKSRPGHHQKIIEYLSQVFGSEDIGIIGDKMRKDRNLEMYCAETLYSQEEIKEYLKFVEGLYKQIKDI